MSIIKTPLASDGPSTYMSTMLPAIQGAGQSPTYVVASLTSTSTSSQKSPAQAPPNFYHSDNPDSASLHAGTYSRHGDAATASHSHPSSKSEDIPSIGPQRQARTSRSRTRSAHTCAPVRSLKSAVNSSKEGTGDTKTKREDNSR